MRAFWCSGLRICSTEMVPFIFSVVSPCTENFIELCFQVLVGNRGGVTFEVDRVLSKFSMTIGSGLM